MDKYLGNRAKAPDCRIGPVSQPALVRYQLPILLVALLSALLVSVPRYVASAQSLPTPPGGQFLSSELQTTDEALEDLSTVVTFDPDTGTSVETLDDKTLYGWGGWFDGGRSVYFSNDEGFNTNHHESPFPSSVVFETLEPEAGTSDYVTEDHVYVDVDADGIETPKPDYGSLYTHAWDFTGASEVELSFKYLVVNPGGDTLLEGDIYFEISVDGGETFVMYKDYSAPSLTAIGGVVENHRDLRRHRCGVIWAYIQPFWGNCVSAADDEWPSTAENNDYWRETSLTIPGADLGQHTVFRLKSYLDHEAEPAAKFHIDDLTVTVVGDDPVLSRESVTAAFDNLPSNHEIYDAVSFDLLPGGEHDWGIWTDGGRNAYLTEFLASEGATPGSREGEPWAVALRDRYIEGQLNEPGPNGEDNGEQKPTYSSIVTANTDFSHVADLHVAFELTAYNTSIVAGDSLTLSISTNAGLDYYPVRTWTAGEDFVNLYRYHAAALVPGDITETGRLTTTTRLKLQVVTASDRNQIYLDNIRVASLGSGVGTPVANLALDWAESADSTTVIKADTSHEPVTPGIVPAYDIFNSAMIRPEIYEDGTGQFSGHDGLSGGGTLPCAYGAVEHTDNSHILDNGEFWGPHIQQGWDDSLQADAFRFYIHQEDSTPHAHDDRAYPSPDTDRCRTDAEPGEDSYRTDRQRMEVKAYDESPEHLLAEEGEVHYYSWKMKLSDGSESGVGVDEELLQPFSASDKFTHLHQLKPVGGPNASMPTITLTPNGAKTAVDSTDETAPAMLNLRYSDSTASQVTVASAELGPILGQWVQILEKVQWGTVNEGRYEFLVLPAGDLDAEPIMSFTSDSLPLWKGGDFVRPKWGVYRSISQGDKVKSERIDYADFVVLERDGPDAHLGDLRDFGYYANSLSDSTLGGSGPVEGDYTLTVAGTAAADEIHITAEAGANVLSVNGVESELTATQMQRILVQLGDGDDVFEIDANVSYGQLRVEGQGGSDLILGGGQADELYGGADADVLFGGGGDDSLFGQNGDDVHIGLAGIDVFAGGPGVDIGTSDDNDGDHANVEDFGGLADAVGAIDPAFGDPLPRMVANHMARYLAHAETVRIDTDADGERITIAGWQDENYEPEPAGVENTVSVSLSDWYAIESSFSGYEELLLSSPSVAEEFRSGGNEILTGKPETLPYAMWRLRGLDKTDLTNVKISNMVYDAIVAPYLDVDPDNNYVGYYSDNIFQRSDGRFFTPTLASITYFTETPPLPSLGNAEGRFDEYEENFDNAEEEVGYFVAIDYKGVGAFEVKYDAGAFAKKRIADGDQEIGRLLYFRKTDDFNADSLQNLTFQPVNAPITYFDETYTYQQTSWSLADETPSTSDGLGVRQYEVGMTVTPGAQSPSKTTATVTLIKTGYEPSLDLWKPVDSLDQAWTFDLEHMYGLLTSNGYSVTPQTHLEYVRAMGGKLFSDTYEVYEDPDSFTDLSIQAKRVYANFAYVVAASSRGQDLSAYAYTDAATGESFVGKDDIYRHLAAQPEMQDLASRYEADLRAEHFGVNMSDQGLAAVVADLLGHDDIVELLDISTPEMYDAVFNPLLALAGVLDEDIGKAAYKEVQDRQALTADPIVVQRRLEACPGHRCLASAAQIAADTGFTSIGVLAGDHIVQVFNQWNTLTYGQTAELASILREVRVADPANATEAKAILESLTAGIEEGAWKTHLREYGTIFIEYGLFDAIEVAAAVWSITGRVSDPELLDSPSERLALVADAAHLLHGAMGTGLAVSNATRHFTDRFCSCWSGVTYSISEAVDAANVTTQDLIADVAAADAVYNSKQDLVNVLLAKANEEETAFHVLFEATETKVISAWQTEVISESERTLLQQAIAGVLADGVYPATGTEVAQNLESVFTKLNSLASESYYAGLGANVETAMRSLAQYRQTGEALAQNQAGLRTAADTLEGAREALENSRIAQRLSSTDQEVIANAANDVVNQVTTDSTRYMSFIRTMGVIMRAAGILAALSNVFYLADSVSCAVEAADRGHDVEAMVCGIKSFALVGSAGMGVLEAIAWAAGWTLSAGPLFWANLLLVVLLVFADLFLALGDDDLLEPSF